MSIEDNSYARLTNDLDLFAPFTSDTEKRLVNERKRLVTERIILVSDSINQAENELNLKQEKLDKINRSPKIKRLLSTLTRKKDRLTHEIDVLSRVIRGQREQLKSFKVMRHMKALKVGMKQ